MAPVELQPNASILPVAVLGSRLAIAAALTIAISRSIFRSYLALPPSQATRLRQPSRRAHLTAFFGLAAVSLVCAGFFGYAFASLSYRVWASARGIELPNSFLGDKGAFRGGEHPGRLQIARWLNDVYITDDALEIVAEKARRFWWGQQLSLSNVAWSLLLATEGRRRNIQHLWGYLVLSHTVSLSFAQNLFYVAMLLTPVPLPNNVKDITRSSMAVTSSRYSHFMERITPTRPENWCAHPALYLVPCLASFLTIFLTPFAANTPSFPTVVALTNGLSYAPLLLPYIIPESWGTVHAHPHDAKSAYRTLYRITSIASFLLHAKTTTAALIYNAPDAYYSRHTLLHPFRQEHRNIIERSSTAVGRVLGAIGDHPAVSAVGWDVLLSGLSLGVWSTVRGLDASKILDASGVPFVRSDGFISEAINNEDHSSISEAISTSVAGGSRRSPRRSALKSDSPADELASKPTKRASRRQNQASAELTEESTYTPTPAVEAEVRGGDEDNEEDWEAGALTWGIVSMGGLGVASSGVYGAT